MLTEKELDDMMIYGYLYIYSLVNGKLNNLVDTNIRTIGTMQ